MNIYISILVLFLCPLLWANPIKIVTSIPELAEISKSIGKDFVEVKSLLDGTENAHYLDVSPYFIRKLANADLVCFVGLELEDNWINKALEKTGKASIQKGSKSYCETGTAISVLEKPSHKIDRSMGDVHASGNPHYHLSPDALAEAAKYIHKKIEFLLPQHKKELNNNLNEFLAKMSKLKLEVNEILNKNKVQNLNFVEYHKEFTYYLNAYNISSLGSIEKLPGVPPSAKRLAEFSLFAKTKKVKLAIAAHYSPKRQLEKFKELSGVKYVQLPAMVQTQNKEVNSIEKLQKYIAYKLVGSENASTTQSQ